MLKTMGCAFDMHEIKLNNEGLLSLLVTLLATFFIEECESSMN